MFIEVIFLEFDLEAIANSELAARSFIKKGSSLFPDAPFSDLCIKQTAYSATSVLMTSLARRLILRLAVAL